MNDHDLLALGWNAFFQSQLDHRPIEPGCLVGRVLEVQRDLVQMLTVRGELWAAPAGRLRHGMDTPSDLPTVGDFAVVRHRPGEQRGLLVRLLDRKSRFARKAPETGIEQTIVSNVDLAMIVAAAGHDLNLRRIERYLAMTWESGATPVVVLTKCDTIDDVDSTVAGIEAVSPGVRAIATSAVTGTGIESLRSLIRPGETAVLLGSSGAGKSTLVNALVGRTVQAVAQVSGHRDKGRHTTTSRKLITLDAGGMIIDTPGLRELALLDVETGVSQTFEEVERIAARCRFTDCRHDSEPGCAIRAALETGELSEARYASYRKLQREAAHEARRSDVNLMRAERERWKKRSRHAQENMRRKGMW